MFWIHGGLALAAGIVILLFPKVFFFLIGSYLVLNAGVAWSQGADPLFSLALGFAGVLVFISPGLVAWFIAFYLLIFAGLLVVWSFWFLAVPVLGVAVFVLLAPKIAPFLTGGFLILVGGLSLAATFFGGEAPEEGSGSVAVTVRPTFSREIF